MEFEGKPYTVLKCAVSSGRIAMVNMLFTAGADIHAACEDESLLLASAMNDVAMMRVMLKKYSEEMFRTPVRMNEIFIKYPTIKEALKKYREKIYEYLVQLLQEEKKIVDGNVEKLGHSEAEHRAVLADRLGEILRNRACPLHQLFFLGNYSSTMFRPTINSEKIDAQLAQWIRIFRPVGFSRGDSCCRPFSVIPAKAGT
jgi:hypothetical protein